MASDYVNPAAQDACATTQITPSWIAGDKVVVDTGDIRQRARHLPEHVTPI